MPFKPHGTNEHALKTLVNMYPNTIRQAQGCVKDVIIVQKYGHFTSQLLILEMFS
jgi:hypothetical protein